MKINIDIAGIPAPGGSKRGFYIAKLNRVVITDAGGDRTKNWRATCAESARQQYAGDPLQGPLQVTFLFFMPRPKGHYGTGRNDGVLKPNAPMYHTSKPDALKLARSTEDALTGIVWGDDAQTALLTIEKRYGTRPGCRVIVETMAPQQLALTPAPAAKE